MTAIATATPTTINPWAMRALDFMLQAVAITQELVAVEAKHADLFATHTALQAQVAETTRTLAHVVRLEGGEWNPQVSLIGNLEVAFINARNAAKDAVYTEGIQAIYRKALDLGLVWDDERPWADNVTAIFTGLAARPTLDAVEREEQAFRDEVDRLAVELDALKRDLKHACKSIGAGKWDETATTFGNVASNFAELTNGRKEVAEELQRVLRANTERNDARREERAELRQLFEAHGLWWNGDDATSLNVQRALVQLKERIGAQEVTA